MVRLAARAIRRLRIFSRKSILAGRPFLRRSRERKTVYTKRARVPIFDASHRLGSILESFTRDWPPSDDSKSIRESMRY
jgi:hypothetical protein